MNKVIKEMITCKISMNAFLQQLKTNVELRNDISHLIPEDAIGNKEHPFWQYYAYEAAEQNHFDLMHFLNRVCRFDNSLGDNLNIHSTMSKAFMYYEPDIVPSSYYKNAFDLYLSAVPEYYEGPEVRQLLSDIIYDALCLPKKSQQKKRVKELLQIYFHIENGNRPYWIQGGEWPMGIRSPMKFLQRMKSKDGIEFFFVDADNGLTRIIKQYY